MATQEPNVVKQVVTDFSGPLNLGSPAIFFVRPIGKEIIHCNDYSFLVPMHWLLSQLGEQLVGVFMTEIRSKG